MRLRQLLEVVFVGRLTVRRGDGDITVNAAPGEVFSLIQQGARNWSWKVYFDDGTGGDGMSFLVKGSLLKDNSAETHLELFASGPSETVIAAVGSRGALMEAFDGNRLGVGVKKFRNRVLDATELILRST